MGTADADRKINAVFAACRAALAAIAGMRTPRQRIRASGQLSERLRDFANEAAHVRDEDIIRIHEAEGLSYAQIATLAGVSKGRVQQVIGKHEKQQREQKVISAEEEPAMEPTPMIDPHAPWHPSIAAAVVISADGILVERRHDGRPLWTLPAGEIEPGESPADCAIRETKEECGLQIVVSHVIGERDHPKTGRHMIYLACRPYQGTEVHNGDEAELAEVAWVPYDTALERLVGLYAPVREHLDRTLKP
jgi:8-oxo-dGTP diphosphatase